MIGSEGVYVVRQLNNIRKATQIKLTGIIANTYEK